MPLGSIGGTRFSLSYIVFFVAAIMSAIVLVISRREDDGDLPMSVAVGVAFWLAGWLVQVVTYFGITRLLGLSLPNLEIGLIGVESMPRRWKAVPSLIVAIATVLGLLVLGGFFRLVEGGFQMPVLAPADQQSWVAPSLGFKPSDSMWRSAAWLCWVQALFQMYPLPRSMGRQTLASLTALCGGRLDPAHQINLFRRCLTATAICTIGFAIYVMSIDGHPLEDKWTLVLLLSLLLWASSRSGDVSDMITAMDGASEDGLPDEDGSIQSALSTGQRDVGVIGKIRGAIQSRQDRRKLKEAFARERSEAVDAKRLDEILNRLHHDGPDSLADEDRAILDRVSANLRKQRQDDADNSPDAS